jgi:translation initiation factor 3 subunit G
VTLARVQGAKVCYSIRVILKKLIFCTIYQKSKDDWTVRVSNLPEEATEQDLTELFKPFGKTLRIFLAKDKSKQTSRGFAFVTFMNKDDAQKAIWGVNDYGYNHLILKVEWAK